MADQADVRRIALSLPQAEEEPNHFAFSVPNKGKLKHSFKVCTTPSATDAANSCKGVATKLLAPGASATLSVKLAQSGTYEYLSGVASEAKGGMKGLLTVT